MTSPRRIALVGFLLALVALAIALGSERFLNLIPCALCLVERWPYRFAMLAAILVIAVPESQRRALCWVIVLIFAGAAGAAALHVGVEQHWWPSPYPECMAPDFRGMSAAERFAHMSLRPSKSCEDKDYLIPAIPITMAQANLVYALASAALLAISLRRAPRPGREATL